MPKLTFLPHEVICPEGAEVEAKAGESILDAALRNKISIGRLTFSHPAGEKPFSRTL